MREQIADAPAVREAVQTALTGLDAMSEIFSGVSARTSAFLRGGTVTELPAELKLHEDEVPEAYAAADALCGDGSAAYRVLRI